MALTVGGRRYVLRLTTGACCELEDRCDSELDAIIQQINHGCLTALRGVVWAMLQAEHALDFLEVEQAGDLMDAIGGPAPSQAMVSRFMALNADDSPPERKSKGAADEPVEAGSKWRRLYLEARSIGLSAEAFWALSLKELWRERAAVRKVYRREYERDMTVALMTANYTRAKELPDLKKLLKAGQSSGRTPEQQLRSFAEQYGMKLRIKNKEASDGHAQG